MVDNITAPDDETLLIKLKFATLSFLPALADPFAYIYSKKILDQDMHWYEKNIMGSGPFKLADYQIGRIYSPISSHTQDLIGSYRPVRASRIAASGLRPLRRPVDTMEQRSA